MKFLENTQRIVHAAAMDCARSAREYVEDDERGDIPGWVMITVMSAGLVVVLTILARPLLEGLFTNAMNSVVNP